MNVNSKVLSLFVGIFVLSSVAFLFVWKYEYTQFKTSQAKRLHSVQSNFDEMAALNSKGLESFVYENSYWDEMVSFVSNHSLSWAEKMLVGSIEVAHEYDYIAIYDTKKSTIFYHQHDDEKASIKNFLPRSTLKMKEPFFSHYFLRNGNEIVEIYSAPIQPSKDTKRQSTPRGYLVMGKVWDQQWINRFSKMTNLHLELITDKKAASDGAHFLYPLKSYDNEVIAYLNVTDPSVAMEVMNRMFVMQFLILMVFGLVVIALVYWLMDRIMVKPFRLISRMIVTREPVRSVEYPLSDADFEEITAALEVLFKKQNEIKPELINSVLNQEEETPLSEPHDVVIDMEEFTTLIGSKKLVDKFMRKFLDELAGPYAILPVQIANHEEVAEENLHTLKGMSANVRAYRLYTACHIIDEKYKSDSHIFSKEIDALREAMDEVKEHLIALGYHKIETGGLSGHELRALYDEIKDTLTSLGSILPEKQRILTANLEGVVDPNALEEWDWAMCESEYEKALAMMLKWNIFNEKG